MDNREDKNLKNYINDFYNSEVYEKNPNRKVHMPNDFGLYDNDSRSRYNGENIDINKTINSFEKFFSKLNNNESFEARKKRQRARESEKISKISKSSKVKNFVSDFINRVSNNITASKIKANSKPKTNLKPKTRTKAKRKTRRKKHRINYKKVAIFSIILISLFFGITYMINDSRKIRIVIDAGHGGNDIGSSNDERLEKDDNLEIVTMIKDNLKKSEINKYAKIILTRKDDTYLSLEERVDIVNKNKAKLLISIHRNDGETGNGVEVWIASDHTDEEKEMAEIMMKTLDESNISRNRGVKAGTAANESEDYYLNKFSNSDAMIIELGFISNTLDNNLFDQNKKDYVEKISNSIEEIVTNYYLDEKIKEEVKEKIENKKSNEDDLEKSNNGLDENNIANR